MRGGSGVGLALLALGGCSLLTEIPDDVRAGGGDAPEGGASTDAAARDDSVAPSPTDASMADAFSGVEGGIDGGAPSAVALDAIGPTKAGAGGEATTSPLVWSHTTSGTNRALFVTVTVSADPDTDVNVTSVQYGEASLSLVGIQHTNNKDAGYTTLWAVASPAAGAHSVTVTFTGAPYLVLAGSISFTGVDQATPFRNVEKAGGASDRARLEVTSAPNDMVVTALASGCSVRDTTDYVGWVRNVTCAAGAGNAAQSAFAGAPSVDVRYSIEADWWGVVAADVKAAP
ncbi:MAG: hypothetical protein U0270_37285 [Labilithrix sp.]